MTISRQTSICLNSVARVVVGALCVLLLSSCSNPDDPTANLADYNARLSRVFDAALPAAAATRVPTWPPIADIAQQPTDMRFDLFGIGDAGRCGMLREISEVHGGIQTASQRLLYEMRLLRGLRQCADTVRDDLASPYDSRRNFAQQILRVQELKTRDLPLVYWNATFGAPELRDFFSVSALPLRTSDKAAASKSASALAWLAALGTMSPDAPLPAGEAMEQQYYQLIGNRLGGRTWLSLDLASRELDRSTKLLQDAATRGHLCPNGVPTERARRMRDIYMNIFVARVQPWLGTVAGESRVLSDALENLWQAQQITAPPALARYRTSVWAQDTGSIRDDFASAVRNHELAWKGVLAPCGLEPPATHATL